jgi:hypothetical protein
MFNHAIHTGAVPINPLADIARLDKTITNYKSHRAGEYF